MIAEYGYRSYSINRDGSIGSIIDVSLYDIAGTYNVFSTKKHFGDL
jgi:hypothetical protein